MGSNLSISNNILKSSNSSGIGTSDIKSRRHTTSVTMVTPQKYGKSTNRFHNPQTSNENS